MSMEEEQVRQIASAVSTTIGEQFAAKFSEFRQEMVASQAACSQSVMEKLTRKTHTFKKKGCEAQFVFNDKIDDHVQAAKKQLEKITATDEPSQRALEQAKAELEQGDEEIRVRQKHIRIADRSDWGVVAEYEADELADNSDDEKRLYRARKERDAKRKRAASGGPASRKKPRREEAPRSNEGAARMPPGPRTVTRPIGPCYSCSQMGHLARSCPRNQQPYPFGQSCVGAVGDISVTTCSVDSVGQCHSGVKDSQSQGVAHNIGLKKGVDETAQQNCKLTEYKEGVDKTPSQSSENLIPSVDGLELTTTGPAGACGGQEALDSEHVPPEPLDSFGLGSASFENEWELARSWEWENMGARGPQIVDVQGRLKQNILFWSKVLMAPATVIDWIQNGYRLPLQFMPTPFEQGNHKSTGDYKDFVTDSVQELVNNRCVREVGTRPTICSPLSVVASHSGKHRLVVNLRHLNQFLRKDHFKYEDLRIATLMFEKGDFLMKFDLKSGYHHLDIIEEHQSFLGFAWDLKGVPKYFVFTVLPFGLASACYAFTKLLRPLIAYWRGQGLKVVLYLDDGIVAVKGEDQAKRVSVQIRNDLGEAGFVVNEAKSQWVPVKRLIWLGFEIDLEKGKIVVPESKLENTCDLLQSLVKRPTVPARMLASAIGKLISMSMALGPVTRLMTRSLYGALNTRRSWCALLQLPEEAKSEVEFWIGKIKEFNGQNLWPKPSAVRVVFSDASDTGFGGYTVEHGGLIASGQWTKEEAQQSSTWRELRAVRLVLESFGPKLQNERIRWFTDNQNVVRIVQCGSKKAALQQEALAIFESSVVARIRLEPEWIPRRENEVADYISRIIDYDDWSLNPLVFKELDRLWGPHTIDRFADWCNNQVSRFNSRYYCPGTEAIDAFTCDWGQDINWWCPPPFLVPRLLKHASITKAKGTLVIPKWVSAPFWPLIFPNGTNPAQFVKEVRELPKVEGLFVEGRSGCNLFKGVPNTPVIALRLKW
ncbi:uncharacterized protein [Dysidea avara]|uniref:uncharacterized protein n=2 Tax=Dysidea avara TaxID=196820 RepID=UPI003322506E